MSQKATFEVTIDGTAVRVEEGSTLLEACRQAGKDVPTLCWAQNLAPVSVCRICVVELEGARTLVPSCSRKAEAGHVVLTNSPRVRLSRRMVLELLGSSVDMSIHPRFAQMVEEYGAVIQRFDSQPPATARQPVTHDNPLFVRDYSRCMLCYQCVQACGVEAQNTFAIAVAGRGFDARISTEHSLPLPESACVFCGNCIGVCPTGALMFSKEFELREAGKWDESKQTLTTTICSYCGVGCALTLRVQDNEIVRVTSPVDHPVTHGHLCVKGRFGASFVDGSKVS